MKAIVRIESVLCDRAIWQSDTAKTFRCPFCLRNLFTKYEGSDVPTIQCDGPLQAHILTWTKDVTNAS